MKSIVLLNWALQATTRIVQLFVSGILMILVILIMPGDLRHQYGITGHELQTSLFAFRK